MCSGENEHQTAVGKIEVWNKKSYYAVGSAGLNYSDMTKKSVIATLMISEILNLKSRYK